MCQRVHENRCEHIFEVGGWGQIECTCLFILSDRIEIESAFSEIPSWEFFMVGAWYLSIYLSIPILIIDSQEITMLINN